MCVYMSMHLWCTTMFVCICLHARHWIQILLWTLSYLLKQYISMHQELIHLARVASQLVPVIWLSLLFYGYWGTTAFTSWLKIKLRSPCLSKHFPYGTFLTATPVFSKYFVIFYYTPLSELLRVISQFCIIRITRTMPTLQVVKMCLRFKDPTMFSENCFP